MENATVEIEGRVYYRDSVGNLILAEYVKEAAKKISTPESIIPFLGPERIDKQENFVVLTLDGNNQLIKKHVVTRGLANQSQIHPRETFHPAIADFAVSIIIAHNHPSGNLEASESDLAATKRLVDAGKLLGIPVMDHIIVTALGFKSLRSDRPNYF